MLYDITISGTGTSAAQGFIDPKSIYQYGNENAGDVPGTFEESLAKARANHRYKSLVLAIQFYSGMQIMETTVAGGDASTAPTALTLVVDIDKLSAVTTPDEANAGVVLSGEDAVKRIVARALTRSWSRALEVFDPTEEAARGNTVEYARTGPRIINETVGALFGSLTAAEAAVSVSIT